MSAKDVQEQKPRDEVYLLFNSQLMQRLKVLSQENIFLSSSLFTFLFISLFGQMYDLYIHHESLEAVTRRLSTFTQTGLGTVKALMIFLNRRRVQSLLATINANFGDVKQRTDAESVRLLHECDRRAVRFTLVYILLLVISLTLPWVGLALRPFEYMPIDGGDGNVTIALRRVPFRISFPGMDPQKLVWYLCVLCIHAGVAVVFMVLPPACDGFFVGLMGHAATQLRILKRSLRNMGMSEDVNGDGQVDISKGADRKELSHCVQHHQTILRFVRELDTLLHFVFMTQFAASVGCFCTGVLYVVTDPSEAPLVAGIVTAVLLQLGMICYYGDHIKQESLAISDAAYGCNWYSSPQDVKRGVQLITLRGQSAAVLSIGGVLEVSLSTYAQVLRISYSFFTMVQEVSS